MYQVYCCDCDTLLLEIPDGMDNDHFMSRNMLEPPCPKCSVHDHNTGEL